METAKTADAGIEAPGGLLLVDKPVGMTSHDVVAVVRRATRVRKVGHTGTLDPFATGLLIVLVGRGTRLIPYVEGEPKVYEATIRFGAATDTDDITGQVIREAPAAAQSAVEAVLPQLTGTIDQVPPIYSAKQVGGRRAYAAARTGEQLALSPSRVTVHDWTVLGRDGDDLFVRITCSGGTYIRALARDLGRLAHSAAHLAALRRTRSGPFDVSDALSVDDLEAGAVRLSPLRDAVPSLPTRVLSAEEIGRVSHGNPIAASADDSRVALLDDAGDIIAVAERDGQQLQPRLVLRDA
jgi:tRNA pseudouridine55 synthase